MAHSEHQLVFLEWRNKYSKREKEKHGFMLPETEDQEYWRTGKHINYYLIIWIIQFM